MNRILRTSTCVCGRVRCEAVRAPIVSAVCYCDSCQEGGRLIEALPGATPVRDADGGTPYLTYRDDRSHCVAGKERLVGYKLTDRAPSQRFVASCCNTGMFLKFGPGHWISAYRARFGPGAPPIEMRNQARYRHADTPIPDDAPSYARFPARLFVKLIAARIAMLVGR